MVIIRKAIRKVKVKVGFRNNNIYIYDDAGWRGTCCGIVYKTLYLFQI